MNFKYFIYSSAFFLLLGCQEKKQVRLESGLSDSLALYFKIANDDQAPFQRRYEANQRAVFILKKENDNPAIHAEFFKIANRFWNMNAIEDYKKIATLIIKKSDRIKDIPSLAKGYMYLGDYYNRKLISDSTYYCYSKSQKLYVKLKDNFQIAKNLLNKASVQFSEKDFIGSENSAINALRILNKTKKRGKTYVENIYSVYNILANTYNELQNYNQSIVFHNKALSILEKNNFQSVYQLKAVSLFNIGLVYQNNRKYRQAIIYFHKALQQPNLFFEYPSLYADIKENIGNSKLKIGDFDELPELFYNSLKISDNLQSIFGVLSKKLSLSEYYISKKDTIRAISFAKDVNEMACHNKVIKYTLESLKQLSKIDKKNSAVYSSKYYKINDSLQLAERRIRNKFASIEFENEELTIEKEKLTAEKTNMLYLSQIMILIIIIIFIIINNISKNRKLEFSRQQQKSNEEIYKLMLDQQKKIEEGKQIEKKRISQELHDGVMGKLSSIRLNLFTLSKKTDEVTIAKCLKHIDEIQDIEKEIRNIAYDLHRKIFSDNSSFIAVIKNIFTAIESHRDIHFKLNVDDSINWEIINNNIKMQIYRILQEALQNIDKHADAQNVILTIMRSPHSITIEIRDDGLGFEEQKAKKGFGLKNMKSRAGEIRGKIKIDSNLGNGTKINLIVPIDFYNVPL